VKINKIITNKVQVLLIHAMMNKSLETLLVMDTSNFNHKVFSSMTATDVDIPKDILKKLNNINDNTHYLMIHNHPNNSSFSICDLVTFVSRDKIDYLMVVTNDCQYVAMLGEAENITLEIRQKMLQIIYYYAQHNGLSKYDSADKLIEYFVKNKLLYQVHRNY
jgi:hypothetical protein